MKASIYDLVSIINRYKKGSYEYQKKRSKQLSNKVFFDKTDLESLTVYKLMRYLDLFKTIPWNQYILFFIDQTDNTGSDCDFFFITNKKIIRLNSKGYKELDIDNLNNISISDSENISLSIDNDEFYSFNLSKEESRLLLQCLTDIKKIQIANLDFTETVNFMTFNYIIDKIIYSTHPKNAVKHIIDFYYRIDNDEAKAAFEKKILEIQRVNKLKPSWDFFNESGEKYFGSSDIDTIKKEFIKCTIKSNHLCQRNSVGDKKPIIEYIAKSEYKIKILFKPLIGYLKRSTYLGLIAGSIFGIVYLIFLQDSFKVDWETISISFYLLVMGGILSSISLLNDSDTLKLLGAISLIMIIAGIGIMIFKIGIFVLIIFGFAVGLALFSILIGYIIYLIRKPNKFTD